MPHEYDLAGVYVSPLLLNLLASLLLTVLTAQGIYYARLSRHLAHPPLALTAVYCIYMVLCCQWLFPF